MKKQSIPNTQNETSQRRVMQSSELFSGQKEIKIIHVGIEYILRTTKDNKLILTK